MRIFEKTWYSLIENAPNVIIIIDRKEKIIYINRTLSGNNTKDVIGNDIFDYIQPEYYEMVKKIIRKVFETGEHGSYEIRAVTFSGGISWFETKVGPIKKGEHIVAVALISTEITERKMLELKLKESELKYRSLFNGSNDAIFIHDLEGKILDVNQKALKLFGYTKPEMLSLNIAETHPAESLEMSKKAFEEISHKGFVTFEIFFRKRNGKIFPAEVSSNIIKLGENKVIQGVVRDISDRKKAEQELKASEKRYRLITDNSKEAIFIMDMNLKQTFASPNSYEMLGYTPEELIGMSFQQTATPESIRDVAEIYKEELALEKRADKDLNRSRRFEIQQMHKNGKIIDVEVSATFLRDDDNNIIGILGLSRDISERKEAERNLKESLNRAEFYKDLFAHDINNLLQGILSSNELIELLLKDAEISPQIKNCLSIINTQVDRGSNLVSNVRKLSQLEEQEIALEKIEIVSILKKTIEYIKSSFHDKPINISLDLFSEEIYINGNELIQDVYENLLINAVKHNNNSTVDLIVRISKEIIDDFSKYKFEFIDNSKGIEDRRKTLIFQRVERDAESSGGMGLGLSLVKRIIDIYKGEIWVENRIKNDYTKGSVFVLLIPEMM